MSCKYTYNGKQYTEKELLNLVSSATSLMSVRSRSNEETAEIMKNQAENRFVNLDLFTPYQESIYVNSITTDVIDQIGSLKPNKTIKISPTDAFIKTKAKFENSRKLYEYLEKNLDTDEKVKQAKTVPAYIQKFPQLALIDSVDDITERKNTFANIVNNYESFTEKVKINLRKYGLKINEGSKKFEELKLDEEYFLSLVNDEEENPENITNDERTIKESFEDGSVFLMNPRDTASARVKLFFATVPSNTVNSLGIREYVSYDDIIEDFMQVGSELDVVNYENLVSGLLSRAKARPYLLNVVKMLGELKQSKNTQLIQEIITFSNKAYQDQVLVRWGKMGNAGLKVEIIKSNRESTVRQIYREWLEQQKYSPIIEEKKGEFYVNSKKAAELKSSLDNAKNGTIEEKKAWVKSFMSTIGIAFTDGMVNDLEERANAGQFRKDATNINFSSLFNDNNLFSIIVNKYNTPPTGKAEVPYEEANNALKDESKSFNFLAEIYYRHTPGRYQTGSFRNGENKSIYSYINPSFLERIKKKLKYSSDFLRSLATRSFSSSSNVISDFSKSKMQNKNNFVLDFYYADSLKEDGKSKDGVVRKRQSDKEQFVEAIIKHQNSGNDSGYYNIFTLSDKTVTPTSHITKYTINDQKKNRSSKDLVFTQYEGGDIKNSFFFGDTFKNQLYNLAESEINRIVDYARRLRVDAKLDIANFDKAFQFFYLFPVLNKGKDDVDGARMETIRNKMYQGEIPSKEDVEYIKEQLTDVFKSQVVKTMRTLVKQGVIKVERNPNTNALEFATPLFDYQYMSKPEIAGLNSMQKVIYAVSDFKFNYLRSQITTMQIFGADPALFFKLPKSLAKVDLNNLTLDQKISLVKSTMDEFSKRAAMFIAPGSQGSWKWYDKNGNIVDASTYSAITIQDVVKNTELFNGVETTDAQEYITLQEYIDRLMSEGRISLDIWQSITDKINKNPDFYTLSPAEKEIVYQPIKPVQTNSLDINGFTRIDYVKSSAFPLIPEVVAGTPLDKLRSFMESNKIRSANFKSAKKTGQPGKAITMFDEEGNFIEPSKSDVDASLQNLSREGLHTQQEIPGQKDEIANISQMNRTLFDGLLDIKNFELGDETFNGKEFKTLKENIRIALFSKAKDEFLQRFGFEESKDGLVYKLRNKKAFEKLLREEALERNFSINDIAAIKIDNKGNLIIPPYLMPRAEKFEGLINSLISKIVRLKNPGTSLVQVSGVSSKLTLSDLNKEVKSEIIWLPSYDPKKGLQYMRRGESKVSGKKIVEGNTLPAQVIVSQYIRDEEGNLIDLSKFIKVDKQGRKILDTSKFSPELFQLVASRIPNQSLPSTLPVEVVGFLPSYMENTIIVPDGITKQMGSDFDVDKLYAYLSSLNIKYSKSALDKIVDLQKKKLELKEETQKQNENLFKDYIGEEDLNLIKKLKDAKNKIIDKLKWNISEKEKTRKQVSIDNLNKQIDALYENVKNKDADAYLKLEQKKFLNRNALDKQLATINEQIKKIKSDPESILGAEKIQYDLLTEYGGENNWGKLKDNNSEDQLHQMYRDLHWAVLTHPAAFDKIAKSIDFNDINEEAALFEKEGLFKSDDTYTPMDVEEQIQIFNDNRSGKVGTGIFASLGSFLADNQDKNIVLGFTTQTGEKIIDPIIVLNDEGEELELYKITKDASVTFETKKDGETVLETRTKGDNNSMVLSESLDNAKNKNLYKFDWGESNMSALSALIALSSEKNETLRINFATRFFRQDIITDYNRELSISRDSFSDFVKNVKEETYKKLVAKYEDMMSENYRNKLALQRKEGKYKPYIFSSKNLLSLMRDSPLAKGYQDVIADSTSSLQNRKDAEEFLNDYAKKQLDLFDLYLRLSDIGSELSTVIGASYVYTKGVGSSIFDVLDGLRKLGKLKTSSNFLNLDQMAGDIDRDQVTGISTLVGPVGEIGHSIQFSLELARQVYQSLYPIEFGGFFATVSDRIFSGLGLNKRDVGSERYKKINKSLMKGIRSYLFSSSSLGIFENAKLERERILRDSETNKSLATRIIEAKQKYPELQNNYFIKNLDFFKSGYINQIYYKSPFSANIDELENNKGFLSLIFSNNDELINIAKDLAVYGYITGGNQTNSSFSKFIPIEYFLSDKDFSEAMQKLSSFAMNDTNFSSFYRQYIQNNPEMATKMTPETFLELIKIKSNTIEGFTVDVNNEKIANRFLTPTSKSDGLISPNKFADFISYSPEKGKVMLFQRVSKPSAGKYVRINTLGTRKAGFVEYDLDQKEVESIIPLNMTKQQLDEYSKTLPAKDVDYFDMQSSEYFDDIDVDDISAGFDLDLGDIDIDFEGDIDLSNIEDIPGAPVVPTASSTANPASEKDKSNPTNYTNHSGGAEQADSIFDEMGKRYGVINHKHYYDKSSKKKPPLGNTPLSKEQMDEGIAKVKATYAQMGRPDNPTYYSLHGRNWFQVKNADAVFAVSDLIAPGEMGRKGFINKTTQTNVEGGTGYAVQMAINEGKPVYVYHQDTALSEEYEKGWYTYDYNIGKFVKTATPTLTFNFAGVGTSDSLTEDGVQAIEDLYKNTFKSLATTEEVQTINQGETIEYTPKGKEKQTYTVVGNKIFNSKGAEVFKTDSVDRNKIFANLAVKQGRAVVVTYRDKRYVVNNKDQIISIQTGDIMKWGPENGDRKAILSLANEPKNLNVQQDTSAIIKQDLEDNDISTGGLGSMIISNPGDDIMNTIDPAVSIFSQDNILDPTEIDIDDLDNTVLPEASSFAPESLVDTITQDIIPNLTGNNRLETVLDNISKTTSNQFFKDAIKIIAATGFRNVSVIIDENMTFAAGDYLNNVIRINPQLAKKDNPKLTEKENLETTIMHEVLHAYTAGVLNTLKTSPKTLTQKQVGFGYALKDMFETVQKKVLRSSEHGAKLAKVIGEVSSSKEEKFITPMEKSMYYGLTSLDEFVSMIMTDKTFQQFMNTIMYNETKNVSILEKFKQLLKDLFKSLASSLGIDVSDNSVLYNGIDKIVGLISETGTQDFSSNDDYSGDPDETAFDLRTVDQKNLKEYDLATPNGIFEANDDQKNAINRVSEFFNKPLGATLEDNSFLLYGSGGTGKTASTATAIRKSLSRQGQNKLVSYAAISHTAKGELIRAGNKDAKTLASLLGSEMKISPTGEETFELIPVEKYLEMAEQGGKDVFPEIFYSDWIVIDEASMIGTREIEALKKRIKERKAVLGQPEPKVLFMGDYAQIPPIGEAPDQDGWAINLRKNSEKSVGLFKVERTKNEDITNLGMRFRRAIDYYNKGLLEGVSSAASPLKLVSILDKDTTISSENVMYTSNKDGFVDKFIDTFRKDPYNSRNAIMVMYNNENHPETLKINSKVRQALFGTKQAIENAFLPGDAIFLGDTILKTYATYKNGKEEEIDLPKNSRLIIKNIKEETKSYNLGTSKYPSYQDIPVYNITGYYGDALVSVVSLNKNFARQINDSSRYGVRNINGRDQKGYILDDGSFFLYKHKLALKEKGVINIFHGYAMSSHKIQGQTYNHSFVNEENVRGHVKPGQDGSLILTPKNYAQIMYTGVSRAREKAYVLTKNVTDEKGTFVESAFQNPMKSIGTFVQLETELPNELTLENQCKL